MTHLGFPASCCGTRFSDDQRRLGVVDPRQPRLVSRANSLGKFLPQALIATDDVKSFSIVVRVPPGTSVSPFRYFSSSPEVIGLVVMMYVRYPLSLRNVEDLLAERGIDISRETGRFRWNRFGPISPPKRTCVACSGPEPFQPGTSSRRARNLQTEALGCAGQMAHGHGLILTWNSALSRQTDATRDLSPILCDKAPSKRFVGVLSLEN